MMFSRVAHVVAACICLLSTSPAARADEAAEGVDWPALTGPILACRGCEHSGRFVEDNPGWGPHLVTLFITDKNPDGPWQTAQQHLWWANDGAHCYIANHTPIVIMAHPSERDFDEIVRLEALTGIEISHGGDAGQRERLWDGLITWRLQHGRLPLWGFGADDTHSITNIDRSWIATRLYELNEKALNSALHLGNFYVSNGPVISDIKGATGEVTVEVRLAHPGDIRWVRNGQYGIGPATVSREAGENHCLKIDRNVAESSYTLNEADGTTDTKATLFIRCIVTTSKPGEAAFTQPFHVYESTTGAQLSNHYEPRGKWYKGQTHNHSDLREGNEQKVRDYFAAYAAKGHAFGFETGYDYWVMPFLRYPPDRIPTIDRVEPARLTKGKVGKVRVIGSLFAKGSSVFLNGRTMFSTEEPVVVSRTGSSEMVVSLPESLDVGRFDLTVRNPDGLQDTLQYAFTVQPADSVNDGWTNFMPQNSSLGSRYSYCVAADPRGGVWIGTNYGLNHYDGKSWQLYRRGGASEPIVGNTIYDVTVDPDGTAWYTCFGGVGMLWPDSTGRQWPWRKIGIPTNQVNQILLTGDKVYVTPHNRRGLFVYRDDAWSQVDVPAGRGQGDVLTGMAVDGSGGIWFGSRGGLLRMGGSKTQPAWTHYTSRTSGLPDDRIVRVCCDRHERLWIATATQEEGPVGGLVCWDDGAWRVYDPTNSPLPERRVWAVFVDRDDRVWAATSKGVACLYPDGDWRVYNVINSGLADDFVTDVAQDNDGNLWFATANGVSRLSPNAVRASGTQTRPAATRPK
jgi:hypothetical protein